MSKQPVTLKRGQVSVGMLVRTTNGNEHGVVIRVYDDWQGNEVVIVEGSKERFASAPADLVRTESEAGA